VLVSRKSFLGIVAGGAVAALTARCAFRSPDPGEHPADGATTAGRLGRGGVIDVATIGEPPTLDAMASTVDLVGVISQHIFETLYTFDAAWRIVPLLAARLPDITPDGLSYTITLREGVPFHDGQVMTSHDVVASLRRWMTVATRGRQAARRVARVEAVSPTMVRITMSARYAPLLALLAFNNSAAIVLPANRQEVPMQAPVGTGPYRLQRRLPDRYTQLVRFERYAARPEASNGYGGARLRHLDEIRFVPVPDASTRLEGAVSGQFDFVSDIPVEAYGRLVDQPRTQPVILKPFGWVAIVFNTRRGPGASQALRRAVRTALNMGDIMMAAFGDPAFYALNGSLYPPGSTWHSWAGVDGAYNLADPVAARALARAAGYDGTPLRFLTSRQQPFHYKTAFVAADALRQAGFAVELQLVDWATLSQRRANPDLWDMYVSDSPFLPEPALLGPMNAQGPGGWSSPARNAALAAFEAEMDPAKRIALWARMQEIIMAEAPIIKVGDYNSLSARSPHLRGVPSLPWPAFWNASVQA